MSSYRLTITAMSWTYCDAVCYSAVLFFRVATAVLCPSYCLAAEKVGPSGVVPSSGITLARIHGGSSGIAGDLAVVGLCNGGTSLAVFTPSSESLPTVQETPLPSGFLGSTGSISKIGGVGGTNGAVLELQQGDGGTVAIALGSRASDGTGSVAVVESSQGGGIAWSCPKGDEGGCALAGGVSPSGQTFVSSVFMTQKGLYRFVSVDSFFRSANLWGGG